MDRRTFGVFFALTLLAHGFCLPSHIRMRRQESTSADTTISPTVNDEDGTDKDAIIPLKDSGPISVPIDPSDDDEDDLTPAPASSGGGSNIFSIFNLLGAILPSSSIASHSEGEESSAPSIFWTLKLDILRALVQFTTSFLGLASSTAFHFSSQ
ncbi:uncharacterized protein LOC110991483 [Pieris rapae]|uniref:uncharacterized protein LOC110991483 n=1 Tax=Pieris rapae TaxID=64459 RepID=UPI001E27C5DE|nr:uncharacterized protein LOC110991483 [Pieris rapae]